MGKKTLKKFKKAVGDEFLIQSNLQIMCLLGMSEIVGNTGMKIVPYDDENMRIPTSIVGMISTGSGTGKSYISKKVNEMLKDIRKKVVIQRRVSNKLVKHMIENAPISIGTTEGVQNTISALSKNRLGANFRMDEFFTGQKNEQGSNVAGANIILGAYDAGEIESKAYVGVEATLTKVAEDANVNLLLLGNPHDMINSRSQSSIFLTQLSTILARRSLVSYIGEDKEQQIKIRREQKGKDKKISREDVEKQREEKRRNKSELKKKLEKAYDKAISRNINKATTTLDAEVLLSNIAVNTYVEEEHFFIGESIKAKNILQSILINRKVGTLKIASIFAFFDDKAKIVGKEGLPSTLMIEEKHIEDAFQIVVEHEQHLLLLIRELTKSDEMIVQDYAKQKMESTKSEKCQLSHLDIERLPLKKKHLDMREIYNRVKILNNVGLYCEFDGEYISFSKKLEGKELYSITIGGFLHTAEGRLHKRVEEKRKDEKTKEKKQKMIIKRVKLSDEPYMDMKFFFDKEDDKIRDEKGKYIEDNNSIEEGVMVYQRKNHRWHRNFSYTDILLTRKQLLSIPERDIGFFLTKVWDEQIEENGKPKHTKKLERMSKIEFLVLDIDETTIPLNEMKKKIHFNFSIATTSNSENIYKYRFIFPLAKPFFCSSKEEYNKMVEELMMYLDLDIVNDILPLNQLYLGYSTAKKTIHSQHSNYNIDIETILKQNYVNKGQRVKDTQTDENYNHFIVQHKTSSESNIYAYRISNKNKMQTIDGEFDFALRSRLKEMCKIRNGKKQSEERAKVCENFKFLIDDIGQEPLIEDESFLTFFVTNTGYRESSIGLVIKKLVEKSWTIKEIDKFIIDKLAIKLNDEKYVETLTSNARTIEDIDREGKKKNTLETTRNFLKRLMNRNFQEKNKTFKELNVEEGSISPEERQFITDFKKWKTKNGINNEEK